MSKGESYKASKLSIHADVKSNGRATAEDDENQDSVAAGPEMLRGDEDELPDDEDGRFFGGGVTKDTADVLDFIEGRDKGDTVSDEWLTIPSHKILNPCRIPRSLTCLGYGSSP